ncbi:NAD dependent epimerase/dehydratase family [Synechococcus sp. PCC 7335]|uniref:SDR family NAD(P)-dependent oxidoreductase n=1 Tax=Synechococcus sp. (strain ATCC 29403 / PCC 7335) TaxID=91464 RepID=UPI00017ED569|nr:SDR family oxidoreductase [Synechococcus sp. PCC 7335]EDX83839.1 NAD dependent epimerase/dehydratase family [Synechococcus sp. PCC 7335]
MSQHVLITGASQGTGKATALKFASKGWDVTLAARQADRLQAVAEQIEAMGSKAIALPTDVGSADQVSALIEKSLSTFGKIDTLINNAGICLTGPMANTSLEDWHRIFDTNFWGYVHTIRAVLPAMLSAGKGTIINVGSIGGKMPMPNMTAYCASKYALTGMTETLRLELVSKGIHVGIVHPGIIDSDFLERAQFRGSDDQAIQDRQNQMNQALQSGLASQPEDIANAIWKAVQQEQNEVVVGVSAIATNLNRLFPALTQWALSKGAS